MPVKSTCCSYTEYWSSVPSKGIRQLTTTSNSFLVHGSQCLLLDSVGTHTQKMYTQIDNYTQIKIKLFKNPHQLSV